MRDLRAEEIGVDPSSYVDPNGFAFRFEGRRLRAIRRHAEPFYRGLFEAGAIDALVERHGLVRSEPAPYRIPELDCPLVVRHEDVAPLNYCVEWCPSMLKAAALATLDLNLAVLERGCVLQDAYPWNIVFRGARPVFVDLTSIVPGDSPLPWPAFQQFLNFFVYPLELSAMGKGKEARLLLRDYVDGVSGSDFRRNITAGHKLRHPLRWLQGAFEALAEDPEGGAWLRDRLRAWTALPAARTSEAVRRRFLEGLRSRVEGIRVGAGPASPWAGYEASRGREDPRAGVVDGLLDRLAPASLLDLGCNTGSFSLRAARRGISVVALDSDEACVEALFGRARGEAGERLLPLIADVLNPTPPSGFLSSQFPGLIERARSDVALCLGLMHHLHVRGRQSFERIAEVLDRLASRAVIFEFVDRSDGMCRAIEHRPGVRYEESDVLGPLERRFRVRRFPSDRPTRRLLLCERPAS